MAFHSWVMILVVLMARTMGGSQEPEEGSSSRNKGKEAGIDKGKGKKNATSASEKRQMEMKTWKISVAGRNFECERQVDRGSLLNHPVVQTLEYHRLEFVFEKFKGYVPGLVVDFYTHMVLKIDRIESMVRGKKIVLTPDIIAKHMKDYRRPNPDSIQFPPGRDPEVVVDPIPLVRLCYTAPTAFTGTFAVGLMTENYRLLNKIVHCNLYPKGNEKTPGVFTVELLYAMLADKVIDFAVLIFNQIYNFRHEPNMRANLPFPCLITKICKAAGLKPETDDKTLGVRFGAIDDSTIGKSKAMSKPPPENEVQGPILATPPRPQSFNEKLMGVLKQVLCRQDDIIKEQKRQKRQLDYLIETVGASSSRPYVEEVVEEQVQDEDDGEELREDLAGNFDDLL